MEKIKLVYITEIENEKVLKNNIHRAWQSLCFNKFDVATVEVLVNGAMGTYIPKDFCKRFNIRNEDGFPLCTNHEEEVYWEDWENVQIACGADIRQLVNNAGLLKDIPAEITLGTNENDGDFELQLVLPEGYWCNHQYCSECGEVFCTSLSHKHVCIKDRLKGEFVHQWEQGSGFSKSLCDLITKADHENTEKLYMAYPDLVDGYYVYICGETYGIIRERRSNSY